MMAFDSSDKPLDHLRDECIHLKRAVLDGSPEMTGMYESLKSWYLQNLKPKELKAESEGELAQFLVQYLKQDDAVLQIITACRLGDWEVYLSAIENQVKYFFAHDLLNYARLMPIHLAQMNALETEDPSVWSALMTGDFILKKSKVPLKSLFTDQSLEQEIKQFKRHGGIIGLSQQDLTPI